MNRCSSAACSDRKLNSETNMSTLISVVIVVSSLLAKDPERHRTDALDLRPDRPKGMSGCLRALYPV